MRARVTGRQCSRGCAPRPRGSPGRNRSTLRRTREEPPGTHDPACRLRTRAPAPTLFNSDRITAMDRASALDCRIDADADVVVFRRGAQDARIRRQIALGQGRHHTAATWTGNAQANRISDGQRVTNPRILDEVLFTRCGCYHDIRPEPRNLKTPLRIKVVES